MIIRLWALRKQPYLKKVESQDPLKCVFRVSVGELGFIVHEN